MATIINTPAPAAESNGPIGLIITLLVVAVMAFMFFVYGLPAIKNMASGPQIVIPNKIDVNVKQTK